MNLSLCITTYNRYELTTLSCMHVLQDPRINEVVILDDASTDGSYEKLRAYYEPFEKVKVIRQARNRGMSITKRDAIALASQQWAMILDSDNEIDHTYLDALSSVPLKRDTIYCPDWAMPQFDYRSFVGLTIDKSNVKKYLRMPMFEQHLNTANYVVPGYQYCQVYQHDEAIKETDTIHFAYLWLKWGGKFHIVPGMRYQHLVHAESGWLKNADYNIKKGREILKMIESL